MLATVKSDLGKVQVIEAPVPEPEAGEIVVRTTMTTICGSDMHFLDEFPNEILAGVAPLGVRSEGFLMGHEAVGIVHAVGPGVIHFSPGDRVISSCLTACGACLQCLQGDQSACSGGGTVMVGCQSEYFRVPFAETIAAKVPDGVSDEQAVLATDIMSTGFGAVERGGAKLGSTVAVFAQGPVGLCATAGARAQGCGRIIAVDTIPERLEMSRRLGANVVINAAETDPVAEIMSLTAGRGVDLAIEAVGTQKTFESCTAVVRRGGTVSSVGVYGLVPQVSMQTLTPSFLHRHLVTTLCPIGAHRMEALLDLCRFGDVDLRPLFTHRMKLEELPAAYELFRSREGGVLKIALTP